MMNGGGSPLKRLHNSSSPLKMPLDLRDVLDSARISFENDLSNSKTRSGSPGKPETKKPKLDKPELSRTRSVPNSPSKRSKAEKREMPKSGSSTPSSKSDTTPSKRPKLENNNRRSATPTAKPKTEDNGRRSVTPKPKRSNRELSSLSQDEGISHMLLHNLPSTRRKVMAAVSRRVSVERREEKTVTAKGTLSRLPPVDVAKVSIEDLMGSETLEILKGLPKAEYVKLWSSPSRYSINQTYSDSPLPPSKPPPSRPSTLDARPSSRVSNAGAPALKQYKDILIRTYPSVAQIILSPVTTGMKNSLNANACEEIMDALKEFGDDKQYHAVMVTGIGSVFCQGVDLTCLTFDSTEKQKKSAESLAHSIRKLTKYLLNYPKLLVAAVNGSANGMAVTMLPLFDVVFASDKATFATPYCYLGQIPEVFASATFPSLSVGHLVLNEMLVLGKTVTATEALKYGLVTSVVWPGKFLEEIVPRLQRLNGMKGLKTLKALTKQPMKKRVLEVVDEETKQLQSCWTTSEFGKNVRMYLKTANEVIFQTWDFP